MDEGKKRDDDEVVEEAERVDLSGLSLDSLPSLSLNLAAITKLDLSNNNLEVIPESLTARLLNVEVLDVHSNQLRVLPSSIGCLTKLKVLNVSGNLMESLPKTIEDCSALKELNVNCNKLTKLPDTMGFELIGLQKLSVSSNKLSHLPYSTSHMTSLRVLDARLNCLRSLPEGLENLLRLEVLDVSQNFHHLQSIPYAVGLLVSLTELDISHNNITHLPSSMGCLTELRRFQAEGNPLAFPPLEVVEQGVDAVRDYLSARMNNAEAAAASPTTKKKSWLRKLVKRGTAVTGSSRGIMDDSDGFLLSDYRSIDGLTTLRNGGLFSPRRLFSSPRRTPSRN